MKNKKLFAILTLVCFMFTLMPVAAFADAGDLTYTTNGTQLSVTAAEAGTLYYSFDGTSESETEWVDVKAGETVKDTDLAKYTTAGYIALKDANGNVLDKVSFTQVEIDLATAYDKATGVYGQKSTIATVKSGLELEKNEVGDITLTLKDAQDGRVAEDIYVWAEATTNEISPALVVSGANVVPATATGAYVIKAAAFTNGVAEAKVAFTTAGTYNLKAVAVSDLADASYKIADAKNKLVAPTGFNTIKVTSAAVDTKAFKMDVYADGKLIDAEVVNNDDTDAPIYVKADGVSTVDVAAGFTYYGTEMPGQEVSISTNSSSIEVSTEKAYTNYRGEVEFEVSGTIEGSYLITLTTGNFSADINVVVGSTAAAEIELIDEPTAPIALDIATSDFAGEVTFEITDVNGNLVYGNDGVENAAAKNPNADQAKYVSFIEKPEGSKLANKNIWIENAGEEWNLVLNKAFDKEGTYSVKVVLDNGRSAVATWEVKEFQTPVEIVIDAPKSVELGTSFDVELDYVDVNGVTKPVDNKTDLAATGYAIADFDKVVVDVYNVDVKTDEKYEGSTITLTAVSQKYALVSTATVAVAAEAVAIEFEDANVETNVNNKIEWNVVDAEGNAVELTKVAAATIKYVVLDKPADAKVSVVDRTNAANFDGDGEMSLTSNKVGNVAVQVIAQVQFGNATGDLTALQTKYYTGTKIFAVGNGQVGDVVVMSIGSNEIVINDAKATIDAAPIVENNRTFVPFRALAEAFGATVAYDEATQAVTAELNGVTVVMTIGSAEYTVNGVAKTADVAPFINGSRTMVPVRFAAEAFGIKVIPTYDENGATADILFNL